MVYSNTCNSLSHYLQFSIKCNIRIAVEQKYISQIMQLIFISSLNIKCLNCFTYTIKIKQDKPCTVCTVIFNASRVTLITGDL